MRHLVTVLRDPVAWILVAAGVVELIAGGTAARGAILFAGAGLILAERIRAAVARSHPSAPSFILRAAPPVPVVPLQRATAARLSIPVAVVGVLVVALLEVHSLAMTAIVGIAGILLVGWAWLTGPGQDKPEQTPWRGMLVWGGLFLALGLWELRALLGQPALDQMSADSPTISYLLEPALATYPGRAIALGLWVAAGRSLIKRS